MKFTLSKLRLGQALHAQVVEKNQDGSLIVNFQGDLLRIVNLARISFRPGQEVELIVSALQPLQFQIQASSRGKNEIHLDRQA